MLPVYTLLGSSYLMHYYVCKYISRSGEKNRVWILAPSWPGLLQGLVCGGGVRNLWKIVRLSNQKIHRGRCCPCPITNFPKIWFPNIGGGDRGSRCWDKFPNFAFYMASLREMTSSLKHSKPYPTYPSTVCLIYIYWKLEIKLGE